MSRLVSTLALLFSACGCAGVVAQTPGMHGVSSPQRATVAIDGTDREYFVQAPPRPASQRPVVFVLHGGTRSAEDIFSRSSWPQVAARSGALLIVPNAIGGNWNDGRTTYLGNFNPSNVDDVGFLRRLVAIAVRDHGADPQRVYFTGASNGGNMSWRMACEAGELVTAIAPVISTMPANPERTCSGARPTPVVAFFGSDDPLMRYDGAAFTMRGRTSEARSSAADSTAFWARVNGCSARTREDQLPDIVRRDQTRVVRVAYEGCPRARDVVRYDVIGGGHNAPGSEVPRLFGRLLGKGNQDIDSVEIAWQFFQRESR